MHNRPDAAHLMVEKQLRRRSIRDEAVLLAMQCIPRHWFVPSAHELDAYGDHALPIGHGQTISQPYMVARMTELLQVGPGVRVLEIGTGSGYQTAVLAQLGSQVVSVEQVKHLAEEARRTLKDLRGDWPINIVVGDGTLGYPNDAPYDRILVTAAAPHLPIALQDQLAEGGRIVIPVGDRYKQILTLFERTGKQYRRFADVPCRFVPLLGRDAWDNG